MIDKDLPPMLANDKPGADDGTHGTPMPGGIAWFTLETSKNHGLATTVWAGDHGACSAKHEDGKCRAVNGWILSAKNDELGLPTGTLELVPRRANIWHERRRRGVIEHVVKGVDELTGEPVEKLVMSETWRYKNNRPLAEAKSAKPTVEVLRRILGRELHAAEKFFQSKGYGGEALVAKVKEREQVLREAFKNAHGDVELGRHDYRRRKGQTKP